MYDTGQQVAAHIVRSEKVEGAVDVRGERSQQLYLSGLPDGHIIRNKNIGKDREEEDNSAADQCNKSGGPMDQAVPYFSRLGVFL